MSARELRDVVDKDATAIFLKPCYPVSEQHYDGEAFHSVEFVQVGCDELEDQVQVMEQGVSLWFRDYHIERWVYASVCEKSHG